MHRSILTLFACVLITGQLQAELKLPAIFSDNAVFQAGVAIPIWGTATPGEAVVVEGENYQSATFVGDSGQWKVEIGPFTAGQKLTVTIEAGSKKVTMQNVLVGEVWLCSGQSNMAMTVNRANDFDSEKAAATFPEIRQFKVAAAPATEPADDVKGEWVICSPETVAGFSATAYFFGRKLHQELGVPVGLINSSVGGTAIEAWTSLDVQENNPTVESVFAPWTDPKLRGDRNHPANLFNGMIEPLIPYAIRGAIWYQGERNARTVETATLYREQLPLLIRDWRTRWDTEFPFLWVQLPNFKQAQEEPGAESAWAVMRESMAESLRVPNTAMAVTIDLGEADDIHPKNKQDVGQRLALAALDQVYDKDIAGRSPMVSEAKLTSAGQVIVTFTEVGDGLSVAQREVQHSFAVRGQDGQWHWAELSEVGADRVLLKVPQGVRAAEVAYAWGDNPQAPLSNSAGLPASPFRLLIK